jgi:hypothetical protein
MSALPSVALETVLKVASIIVGALIGLVGYFLRHTIKSYEERFDDLERKIDSQHLNTDSLVAGQSDRMVNCRESHNSTFAVLTASVRKDLDDIKKDMSALKEAIPEKYLPRNDFIRDFTIVDGKVSALFRKFDRVEAKLDLLLERGEDSEGAKNGEGG